MTQMYGFDVVTEKEARKMVAQYKDVVVIHSKESCPVCKYFVPEVLYPIMTDKKYERIKTVVVMEQLFFPVASHPVVYFFKGGKCVQHPSGSAPEAAVRQLMDTFYG